jgi:hypothetical protein
MFSSLSLLSESLTEMSQSPERAISTTRVNVIPSVSRPNGYFNMKQQFFSPVKGQNATILEEDILQRDDEGGVGRVSPRGIRGAFQRNLV